MFARGLDVGQMSSTISGRHLADIDSMSENHRSSMSETISGRHRTDIRSMSERLDIGNDIRPTSGQCRKTTEARCWKRHQADIGTMLETISGRHHTVCSSTQYRLTTQIQPSVSCNRMQSCMYNNTTITHPSHRNEVYIDKEKHCSTIY